MDVHTLADWPGLEAEAIAAWNRRPAPETGFLGHLVVPKSGVGAVFIGKGEPVPLMGDKGRVVPVYDGPQNVTANDPMEAVAWRWRWPDTNKWHYADYNLHPEAEEVQALAVIPVQGGEG
jgi:L-ascorbate metabolism protein UlaG (beta-lactamase superfamily)